MKYRHVLLIVIGILLFDQISKIYIKTHFYYGESVSVLGDWFQLCFIENEGMAFGMTIMDSPVGKILLTLFRLVAVTIGFFWVKRLVNKGYAKGLLACASLILAGATGNLIDSIFYGAIFSESSVAVASFVPFGQGYAPLLHGKVVDMLYFPIIDTNLPEWLPFWGGNRFRFFEPIFNIADTAISTGIITLLVFQKRWMTPKANNISQTTDSSSPNIQNS